MPSIGLSGILPSLKTAHHSVSIKLLSVGGAVTAVVGSNLLADVAPTHLNRYVRLMNVSKFHH